MGQRHGVNSSQSNHSGRVGGNNSRKSVGGGPASAAAAATSSAATVRPSGKTGAVSSVAAKVISKMPQMISAFIDGKWQNIGRQALLKMSPDKVKAVSFNSNGQ